MKRMPWMVAVAVVLWPVVAAAPAPAQQPTVIKLCSLVPEGSVWDKALREMGAEWRTATQGRVVLQVFPGGTAGDEPTFVRKMRIGQFQAAAVTTSGLSEIDPAFKMFEIPMFFSSYEELHAVLDRLEPTLQQRLADKGFRLLSWGHGGWVYYFTKQKATTVADLRKAKLYWFPDDRMVQVWRKNGFNPVPLSTADILTGMQTGMIDAYPSTPLLVLALQWDKFTPNMASVGMAPLVGGLVITEKAWQKISEPDRAKVMAACRKLGSRLEVEIPRQDTTAVVQMQKRGLTVVPVSAAGLAEWRAVAEEFSASMRGSIVPPEILDAAKRERDAFRRGATGGGSR
jgi:TRAP-type C4-dicarboxylate transport system substrate-binding protein